ncbi:hypothetical protein GCM10023115_54720 [Pontixanthobacter gangjinensis]
METCPDQRWLGAYSLRAYSLRAYSLRAYSLRAYSLRVAIQLPEITRTAIEIYT